MADDKYKVVSDLLGAMTLEEKIGQLFVFGLNGSQITPDLVKAITKLNCSGIRVTPNSRIFARYKRPGSTGEGPVVRQPKGVGKDLKNEVPAPYLTLQEYASILNQLKTLALNRPHGIPVHIVLDQEGNGSADLSRGGNSVFSPCDGINRHHRSGPSLPGRKRSGRADAGCRRTDDSLTGIGCEP